MNHRRALGILVLIAASSSTALAEEQATQNSPASAALPSLPVFELPARASDSARLHVSLAHARRDSQRAEHSRPADANRAAASAHKKTAQRHLEAARVRQAAAQARRDAAQLRRADARERRAEVAAQRQLNAEARRAATQERRANAGR